MSTSPVALRPTAGTRPPVVPANPDRRPVGEWGTPPRQHAAYPTRTLRSRPAR